MADFMYPRTIAVTRPGVNLAAGLQSYGGVQPDNETAVASGLPASIQRGRGAGRPVAKVPADAHIANEYNIFIPALSAALGLINIRDIITDDLGVRYQVIANYWNSLGYKLICEELKA